jgi:hypothetical protein
VAVPGAASQPLPSASASGVPTVRNGRRVSVGAAMFSQLAAARAARDSRTSTNVWDRIAYSTIPYGSQATPAAPTRMPADLDLSPSVDAAREHGRRGRVHVN